MDSQTQNQLMDLNKQFYQTFADDFSETRMRLQPGVLKIITKLRPNTRVLDLGCGNGQLALRLAADDFQGSYIGTDFSPNLLERARRLVPEDFPAVFRELDLTREDWGQSLPPGQFDYIFAFATLHHIPGHNLRESILRQIHLRLKAGGVFALSNWQFLNSERLRRRIQPWEAINLSAGDVDAGDHLLDWRRGGYGLRYVHHFKETELNQLAHESGFSVQECFYSDGKTGDLALYQVWTSSPGHS